MIEQTNPTAVRTALLQGGHLPIPCIGKRPALKAWTDIRACDEDIDHWRIEYAAAENTGILAFKTPAIDVDVRDPTIADMIEEFVRAQFSREGCFLVRTGNSPKRLFPFRATSPFDKIKTPIFFSALDAGHQVEVLASGQLYVACGIHPDTGASYSWSDPLWSRQWNDLPLIDESCARKVLSGVEEIFHAAGWRPNEPRVQRHLPARVTPMRGRNDAEHRLRGVLGRVAAAVQGERNNLVFWGACRVAEMVRTGAIGDAAGAFEAPNLVSLRTGLPQWEVTDTIQSALRRA
jgi:hypothetical protein